MPHYLGIDFGEKRIGLAFGDDLGVAIPIDPSIGNSQEVRIQIIADTITKRKIDELVVGYPLNMNGTKGPRVRQVDRFINKLEVRFKLPVHRVDERLSSHQVESQLKQMKQKLDRASGELDSRAASLFLQEFLDQNLSLTYLPDDLEEGD